MKVECYAGQRNPERPIAFEWEGERVEVEHIAAESRQPDGWRFTVSTRDGRNFELFFHEQTEDWTITRRC
jgi:hypothetical protein